MLRIVLRPKARSVSGAGGRAISVTRAQAFLLPNISRVEIGYGPEAIAIAGPGGYAYADNFLDVYMNTSLIQIPDYEGLKDLFVTNNGQELVATDDDENVEDIFRDRMQDNTIDLQAIKTIAYLYNLIQQQAKNHESVTNVTMTTAMPTPTPPTTITTTLKNSSSEEIGESDEDSSIDQSLNLMDDHRDSLVAEAKPHGIAVVGKHGLAASKPLATAIAGDYGLALAQPVATAIAGLHPADAIASIQTQSRPKPTVTASSTSNRTKS